MIVGQTGGELKHSILQSAQENRWQAAKLLGTRPWACGRDYADLLLADAPERMAHGGCRVVDMKVGPSLGIFPIEVDGSGAYCRAAQTDGLWLLARLTLCASFDAMHNGPGGVTTSLMDGLPDSISIFKIVLVMPAS